MKIVLFSSIYPGKVNELNISRLMSSYPDYDFAYVLVDNRYRYFKSLLKNRLKEIFLFFLYGRDNWVSALRIIEKSVSKKIPVYKNINVKKIHVKQVNSKETEEIIRGLKPDLMIQCGAGILKENTFSIPSKGTINVHHGIAPELRGISSTFWAMYYGLNEYIGITVHFIDKTLDTGAVIIQKKTEISSDFNFIDAVVKTSLQGADVLVDAISIINQPCKMTENEVKSFYFSSVNYKKYSELMKNSFRPVGDIRHLKFKIKSKKILLPIE